MDLTLTPAQLELQARARAFVRDVLQPREVEFERAGGRVPRDWGDPIRRAAIEARLHGGSLPGRGRRAGLVGRSSRSSSTSSSASRPAACGRTSRAPTTSLLHADAGAAPSLPRAVACAASARGATRSPRTAPAPMRGPCAPPPSATRATGRVPPQRREVVRDRPRRHRLHDLPLPRRRRRRTPADALPGRLRHARRRASSTTPTTPTRSPTATRSSC